MRFRKEYDKEKDWKERTSTGVLAIVIFLISIVLFVTSACMFFTWLADSEAEKKASSEETKVIQAVQEHYGITANETSKCIQIKQDTNTGRKWYVVVINGRVFKAEYHMEDGINIYNVAEVEI